MSETMLLIPVRTNRQGTSLNAGKLKKDYLDETSTVEIHSEDMARLGLRKGDRVRLRAKNGSEAFVRCKERKGKDASPGLMFMAYGPTSSQLMEEDTAGTGMPLSKHLPVEIEGPVGEDGTLLAVPASADFSVPPGNPLSPQQANSLSALLAQPLTPIQAAWLSGYFAALSGTSAMPIGNFQAASTQAAALPLMTIVYGSQTGNGEKLANTLKDKAAAKGYNVMLDDMADYEFERLEKEKILFIVVSTHGEGDPPIAAEKLHHYLQSDGAPRLEQMKYGVFALGDSSYQYFCKTGKDFDRFLTNLGATPLLDRVDADVDFEAAADEWMDKVLDAYQNLVAAEGGVIQTGAKILEFPGKEKIAYSKTNPFLAPVLINTNLSGAGSAKETRHIAIDLQNSGLVYEPGDALGVYPKNNPAYADALLNALQMTGSESVTVGKQTVPLRDAFIENLDITALSRNIIEKYAELIDNNVLRELLNDENSNALKTYIWGRHILDLIEDYPLPGSTAQDFVKILRRIPGRLYSIASSLKAYPDQVHLLVGAVRYHAFNRDREGVCSTFLAGRADAQDKLAIYVQANKNFRLPSSPDVPVIMVGPGTGLAPFRSFLQERHAGGAKGKNWLFFGDQHRVSDYLYGDELDKMHEEGFLTNLSLAFSRDQAQKIYVQNRILERSGEIYAWLEEGAHFYVCGDASRMAHDVHKALIETVAKEGGKSQELAEQYINGLIDAKRYQRDVY
jgi:sulfite reductase (NADPH) flavoprotein alpha-component